MKEGHVTVIPEDTEDLYVLYNVIAKGDRIIAKTTRKVKKGDSGSEKTVRVTLTMELEINEVEFHGFGETIRFKGIIMSASDEHTTLGSHHSINMDLLRQFTIVKEQWSQAELSQIEDAQLGQSTGLIILSIDDEGAVVSQVGNHASKILVEMTPTITRKGSDPNQYQLSLKKFFDTLISFLKDLQMEGKIDNLVMGGPGFIHDKFHEELRNKLPSVGRPALNISTKNSGRSGIAEIITHHLPEKYTGNNSAKIQADMVQQVLEHLGKNTGLVCYAGDVYKAVEIGAIDKLLVLDTELHDTIEKRKKIHTLIDNTKMSRGRVILMSSNHESGKIIEGLGNLVAILRYKLPK